MKKINFSASLELTQEDSRFSGIAYTGVEANGAVVDLSGMKLGSGGRVALIDTHDTDSLSAILGYANLSIVGNTILADGEFTTEKGMAIHAQMKAGVPLEMSIGAWYENYEFLKDNGVINGAEHGKGTLVLRDVHIRELSVVLVGADKNTSITALCIDNDINKESNNQVTNNHQEFDMTPEQLSEVLKAALMPVVELQSQTQAKFDQLQESFLALKEDRDAKASAAAVNTVQDEAKEKTSIQKLKEAGFWKINV